MATHKVGGEVDAQCTRCKLTLAHTILAMVGPKIARVRCNTCNGDHTSRAAPGVTDRPSPSIAARAARAASAAASKAEKVIISFEEQLAGKKDVASAPQYSPKATYQVDQVIQHPTFGTGFVTAVRGDKVDITFRTDTKTLVHGRGGAPADRPAFSPPNARSTGPADKPQPSVDTEAPTEPVSAEEPSAPIEG